jgi:flagellar basal-body rod protein FlgF
VWHCACFFGDMESGIYNTAIRLASGSVLDMEICAENLSNASVPGYKRIDVLHTSFAETLAHQVNPSGAGVMRVNHMQGALRETGRNLDFAIEGDGFFELSDGENTYYTRNGHFRVDADGTIVNSNGMAVQRMSGDLRIPPNTSAQQITVDDNLTLRIGEREIGQLKIVAFDDKSLLQKAGSTLFTVAGNEELVEVEPQCKVLNGYLEQSNTSVFEQMVGMMSTLRNYEACQKILRAVDESQGKMINKLT